MTKKKKRYFPHVEGFLARPREEQDRIAKTLKESLGRLQAELDPIVADLTQEERVAIDELVEMRLALARGEDRPATPEQLEPPDRVRLLVPVFVKLRELGAIFDEFREALGSQGSSEENESSE